MKRFVYLSMMLYLMILLGCKNSIEKVFIDESEVEVQQIRLEKIDLPYLGLVPKGCCFVDSLLVVYNSRVNDSIISVYKDRKLVASFGKIGGSKDELQRPMFVGKGRCMKQCVPLVTGLEYRMYDLQHSDFGNGVIQFHTENMPEDAMLANYVLYNDDSLMVLNVTDDYQLLFYDKINDNSRTVSFVDDKFLGDDVDDVAYCVIVYGASYNCNGKYIVIAYNKQKMIDIVSMSGFLIKRVAFNNYDINKNKFHTEDDGNVEIDDGMIMFFTSIIVDDNFFYAVCQENTEENTDNCVTKTKLYKMDYNGKLLKIYQLDMTATFGVVKDNELFIIGYHKNDEPAIYHTKL